MIKKVSILLVAAAVSTGCDSIGGSDDSDSSESSESSEPTENVGSLSLSELNLSSSMSPTVPSQLDASSASLHLAEGDKSFELCELRSMIDQVKMEIDMAAMMSCQIASTPGVEWGGKYYIDLNSIGGPSGEMPDMGDAGGDMPDMQMPLTSTDDVTGEEFSMPSKIHFYLDNSEANSNKIWICEEDSSGTKKLTQKFVINSAAKGRGAKGSYAIKMAGLEIMGRFDNGISKTGRYRGDVQMRFGDGSFKSWIIY